MAKRAAARRAVAIAGTLLLAVALSSDGPVQAGSRGHGLPGTWFVTTPGGITGFYTYNQDGTMTGSVSTLYGAEPQPSGLATFVGADHGIWRQVGQGFEGVVFRTVFAPLAEDLMSGELVGNPLRIIRIRTFFSFDRGRNSTSGTFLVDQWECDELPPEPSCPDPNSTTADIEGIEPPPPLNTFTQTRVRMP